MVKLCQNAMAGLCIVSTSSEALEPPTYLKIVLGILLGFISLIMITGKGIIGIKMLSTIGGFPATILVIMSGVSLILVAKNPNKFIFK